MISDADTSTQFVSPMPPDDLKRILVLTQADDPVAPHIGLVGGTYTILLGGEDTKGRFCLIDMHVPPGGGPQSAFWEKSLSRIRQLFPA